MLSTQPYKGTRDFYPDEMRRRRWMFSKMRRVVESYAFEEYDGPMLEPFELYAAKTGEEIVNQQLYWMMDRGERKLAVRPEMTPTLARMVAAKIHELPKPVRWYSIPNLWRYERPQKGRLREHWQLNVDILGGDALLADAEILAVAHDLISAFGGKGRGLIKVNNRKLVDAFFGKSLGLSAEAALKATKAIDAKDKIGPEKYDAWLTEIGLSSSQKSEIEQFFASDFAAIAAKYPCDGVNELSALFAMLKETGHSEGVVFDPTIMRGMDYYTGTVFEMYDTSPENRRALFGGGRYDNLVGLFGKDKLPGVGFGLGDVTMMDFLVTHGLVSASEIEPAATDVFVSLPDRQLHGAASAIARDLRAAGLRVMTPLEAGGFGAQLKLAAKHRARFAVLFGESEWARGEVVVKDLASGTQQTFAPKAAVEAMRAELAKAR